jgi:hypothetical protein
MPLEFGDMADPPNVIAGTVGFGVGPIHRCAAEFIAQLNGLQHRAIAEPSPSHVVNLARPGGLEEPVDGAENRDAHDPSLSLRAQ